MIVVAPASPVAEFVEVGQNFRFARYVCGHALLICVSCGSLWAFAVDFNAKARGRKGVERDLSARIKL